MIIGGASILPRNVSKSVEASGREFPNFWEPSLSEINSTSNALNK
ncbi:hypothetical protein C900_04221 [Fulvivirga imtechensis AK7]|uniref:Uncharacterized protein n=1 Tax=Fulvivirga imtechensis AK7 TaxID=1237149 RepID=L8K0B1_9BACT|nr:hypothetical protein C900_04221 [Fulvivirga imtechensis AK7]